MPAFLLGNACHRPAQPRPHRARHWQPRRRSRDETTARGLREVLSSRLSSFSRRRQSRSSSARDPCDGLEGGDRALGGGEIREEHRRSPSLLIRALDLRSWSIGRCTRQVGPQICTTRRAARIAGKHGAGCCSSFTRFRRASLTDEKAHPVTRFRAQASEWVAACVTCVEC